MLECFGSFGLLSLKWWLLKCLTLHLLVTLQGSVNYDVVFMSFKVQGPGCEEQLITDLLRLEYQVTGTLELASQSIQHSWSRDANGC